MRQIGIITAVLVFFVSIGACASCTPSPVLPAGDAGLSRGDAPKLSTQEACNAACAQLTVLGCAEGMNVNCVSFCVDYQTTHKADLRPWCVMGASSPSAVGACGGSASCTQ